MYLRMDTFCEILIIYSFSWTEGETTFTSNIDVPKYRGIPLPDWDFGEYLTPIEYKNVSEIS
jgi:hypothetical protein